MKREVRTSGQCLEVNGINKKRKEFRMRWYECDDKGSLLVKCNLHFILYFFGIHFKLYNWTTENGILLYGSLF